MAVTSASRSAAIRARLEHPVIDVDGHTVEFEPGFLDVLQQVGGSGVVARYLAQRDRLAGARWYRLSLAERLAQRATRPPWWFLPTKNTLDRATATLPRLLHERLPETGIDFTILYPTEGLAFPHLSDEELRRACCRALNVFHAEIFRPYADRMTPAAVIPLHTPQEGIAELDYAVQQLGLKAILIPSYVRRQLPNGQRWLDVLALDSAYDYDPFWARCVELGVVPACHSSGMGWGSRTAVTNYMYNHIGHFAAAAEALCKALFFGGVTRRFPTLKVAFLECGVAWACSLYADLVGHWEKRNRQRLENYNPANLDRQQYFALLERYGGSLVADKLEALRQAPPRLGEQQEPELLDEWAACQITRAEEIRDLFVPHFYFGCEADDPLNAWAFNTRVNPFGARLRAMLSSDIGHWDVPDMTSVTEEAYELVEKGLISAEDFRDFAFTHPATLYAGTNPDFFRGTAVEQAVRTLLAASS
ncbi:MAG: hypothetical protein KatS3mg131_3523 [Candidatus Tectimicrobiota bacterium]|nr:MAG: hypothetical protein KatS3mg131_3523 [Candidatus Tectomicrobia bacterium]